jgi:hypothetical protein
MQKSVILFVIIYCVVAAELDECEADDFSTVVVVAPT